MRPSPTTCRCDAPAAEFVQELPVAVTFSLNAFDHCLCWVNDMTSSFGRQGADLRSILPIAAVGLRAHEGLCGHGRKPGSTLQRNRHQGDDHATDSRRVFVRCSSLQLGCRAAHDRNPQLQELSAPDRHGFLNSRRRSKGHTCHGRRTTRHVSRCRGKRAAGVAKVLLKVRVANILGSCSDTDNGLAQGWNAG
jgi:hypothetical protein